MANFKLRVNGLLNASLKWSMGYNIISTAALATVGSTFDAAVGTLWTTATNGIQNLTASDVTVVNTTVYQTNASWITTGKLVTAHAIAGSHGTVTTDYASSPYVFLYSSANDARSFRGHIKLPPLTQDQYLDGLLINAAVDSLNTVFSAFFTTMKGLAGYEAVSYNRKVNKVGDPAFTPHQLTAYSIGNRTGTQRKRKRKAVATHTDTGSL